MQEPVHVHEARFFNGILHCLPEFFQSFLLCLLQTESISSLRERKKISGRCFKATMLCMSYLMKETSFSFFSSGRPLPTIEENRPSNGRPFFLARRKAFSHISWNLNEEENKPMNLSSISAHYFSFACVW